MTVENINYIDINKALWNEKTKHHYNSAFYDVAAFKEGKTSLNSVELQLAGDVAGRTLLHLQCHFGQDTLSWARLGATATGVDLSDAAIDAADRLAGEIGVAAKFICSDVYRLPEVLNEQFDIVFTSYGTIGWLPDMKRWAEVVSRYLKPGGTFIFVELHPAIWMFDNDFTYVQYPYFNIDTIIENESGTYADRDAPMQLQSVSWNHSLAEVMQSLINEGLQIERFEEHDYCPYNCLNNMVEVAPGKWQIKGMEGKLPMIYSIKATKK